MGSTGTTAIRINGMQAYEAVIEGLYEDGILEDKHYRVDTPCRGGIRFIASREMMPKIITSLVSGRHTMQIPFRYEG